MQHWSPSKAAHAERAASWASSCTFSLKQGFCQRGKPQSQANTKYHTGIQRKGLCHNYTSLFLILSLLHWHQRGKESLCPNVGWWSKKKKTSSAWRKRNRTTEANCRHADLRIASGTVCVKVKREKESTRWIYTAERERESRREGDRVRQRSKLRHEKRKNCCSQENSSLTSASHSNNGGLWFLMLTMRQSECHYGPKKLFDIFWTDQLIH